MTTPLVSIENVDMRYGGSAGTLAVIRPRSDGSIKW
jgi:hypothetical protein